MRVPLISIIVKKVPINGFGFLNILIGLGLRQNKCFSFFADNFCQLALMLRGGVCSLLDFGP